ncbi:enoyl-CoA hydratase/carnithine racemase [Bradyrhizobium sp. LB9.1b]
MAYETIKYEIAEQILTITLNRPDKLNAFNAQMQGELIDAFDAADKDDDVRAIIVTGAGRGFCAGADLSSGADTFDRDARRGPVKRFADGKVDYSDSQVRDGGGQVTLRIFKCLKPVIAAVNGPAVGIGVTMQLAMDIRIASDAARFGFVFSQARHRAGGGLELVPTAHRRHIPGAGMVLFGPRLPSPGSPRRPSRQQSRSP